MKHYIYSCSLILFSMAGLSQVQHNVGLGFNYNFNSQMESKFISSGDLPNSRLIKANFETVLGVEARLNAISEKSFYQLTASYHQMSYAVSSTGAFFINRNGNKERFFIDEFYELFERYDISLRRLFPIVKNEQFRLYALAGISGVWINEHFGMESNPIFYSDADGTIDENQLVFDYQIKMKNPLNVGYQLGIDFMWQLKDGVQLSYSSIFYSHLLPMFSFNANVFHYNGVGSTDFKVYGRRIINHISITVPLNFRAINKNVR